MRNTRATLSDLSEKLGYSKTTVSLALRSSPKIPESTRRKIEMVARKFAYVPNFAAQSLKKGRTDLVGIYAEMNDQVRVSIVNSLFEAMSAVGMKPLVGITKPLSEGWDESSYVKTFLELHVSVIAIVSFDVPVLPKWQKEVPLILVGAQERKNCDCVLLDRGEAGETAARFLLSQGIEEATLVLNNINEDALPVLDAEGFAMRCARVLRQDGFECPSYNLTGDNASMMSLVERTRNSKKRTGLCFCDSEVAAKFMAIAQHSGIDISKDICVVGYDYFPTADIVGIPLTTVEQPVDLLAKYATHVIENRIKNPGSEYNQITLKHRLVVRQ